MNPLPIKRRLISGDGNGPPVTEEETPAGSDRKAKDDGGPHAYSSSDPKFAECKW